LVDCFDWPTKGAAELALTAAERTGIEAENLKMDAGTG
jgi:hypothetical protein